jgi:phage protein D
MGARISFGEPIVIVDGKKIDSNHIASLEVLKDIDQPDMAAISLSNFGDGGGGGGGAGGGLLSSIMDMIGSGGVEGKRFSAQFKPGADLVVKVKVEGDGEEEIFKGQVTGFHPSFDTHLPVSVNVRGMNAMHKLTRERKTRTFVNRTDKQIVEQIVSENGLSVDFGREPPTLLHEHMHQPNMTDLEFLRLRAARTCRETYVKDKTFYFRKRQKDEGPVATLTYTNEGVENSSANDSAGGALESFTPEQSSSGQAEKVTVHGWDPNGTTRQAQMLTGIASAGASSLGSEGGGSAFGDSPDVHIFDIPVRSKEEADLLAKSVLEERNMNFIQAEAVCLGNAKIEPGKTVKINTADSRFTGKYYVAGVHFSFSHSSSGLGGGKGMGGFKGHLKLKRDAGK